MMKIIVRISFLIIVFSLVSFAQGPTDAKRNPLIVIPGLAGSTLVNKRTKETIWVRFSAGKTDDLELPYSGNLSGSRDELVAGDIVERVKIFKFLPQVSVYEGLVNFLEKKAVYKRKAWNEAITSEDQNVYFVYAYDWRRDTVENARHLIERIEEFKTRTKNPNLKFDIVAHSLGGLISRYAAMYGKSDLQVKPAPTWYGAKHLERIFIIGTPNEGTMSALSTLNSGVAINLPAGKFYPQFLGREVAFSMPSMFQLLPHGKSARFLDENLNPLSLDIYDPVVWNKYGWSILADEKLAARFDKNNRIEIENYLRAALLRARRFHESLDVKSDIPASIKFFAFGSDCKKTIDSAILVFDPEKKKWKTLTSGDSFNNSKGERVPFEKVQEKVYAEGDGTVTRRSLFAETISGLIGQNPFLSTVNDSNSKLVCEGHAALPANRMLQESFATIQGLQLTH